MNKALGMVVVFAFAGPCGPTEEKACPGSQQVVCEQDDSGEEICICKEAAGGEPQGYGEERRPGV
ncbi:MAG: hypothetical protein IPK82_23260 [Polyangiaceae bacterium]|nr:hypothetical protein [Polyangiaceae bacterium]